jgi:uncharacterized protein
MFIHCKGVLMSGRRIAVSFRVPAALLAVFVVAAPARAQQLLGSPQLPPARFIVTGTGSVTVPPDYAEIASGVTTQAKSAKEASDANAKVMAAINAVLKTDGIAAEDIQTSRFAVSPVYGPPQPNAPLRPIGFSVSNELSIKVHQVGKVGDILDSLIQAGATDAGSVQFLHSKLSQELDRARQAALADARRKAELYSKSAGLKLGAVAWITEVPASTPPSPIPGRMYAAAGSVPVSVGTDTLNVHITVGFETAR